MSNAPDTLIVTGPNFEQEPIDYALVTPTGGIQMKLRDALAFGGNLSMPPPIGNVIPNTGAFTTLSGSVTSTGSTTSRTLAGRFSDVLNVKDFGAIGDGVTDDTAALLVDSAAAANGAPVVLSPGRFKTTFAQDAAPMRLVGSGRMVDSTGQIRAPYYSSLIAPPTTSSGNAGDFSGWAGKDISRVQFAAEQWISGADTLGKPTSGYLWTNEAAPYLTYFFNTSGWNQSTSGNDGRTGVAVNKIFLQHTGGGDAVAYSPEVLVGGARLGATHFLANPAGSMLAGDVQALNDGVFLQGLGDINLIDNGHDVAGIGMVYNLVRNNNTGALGATWMGIRLQSAGSKQLDAFHSVSGPAKIGFDCVPMIGGTAAIAMGNTQRIYGNATNVDGTGFSAFTAIGTESFGYDATNGWTVKVAGVSVLGVTSTVVSLPLGIATVGTSTMAAEPNVNFNAAAGQAKSVYFRSAGSPRWQAGSDSAAESGSNAGSDFRISRYADGGAFLDTPFQLSRQFGVAVMAKGVQIYGATSSIDQVVIGATNPLPGKFTALTATSTLTLAAPVTVTAATYTVLATDCTLILNPSAGQTLTLGAATAGRVLHLKLISAFAVISTASNVAPQTGGAAGTAILSATAGKWAMLQGDGTNWQILMSN